MNILSNHSVVNIYIVETLILNSGRRDRSNVLRTATGMLVTSSVTPNFRVSTEHLELIHLQAFFLGLILARSNFPLRINIIHQVQNIM